MKATIMHGPGDVRLDEVPDPVIQADADAIVKVIRSCVCGSDLWKYRDVGTIEWPLRIGHEFIGEVVEVGSGVQTLTPGQFVISPFTIGDNTCPNCQAGMQSACQNVLGFGGLDPAGQRIDAGQGEFLRVPMADGTLVASAERPDDAMLASMLALSDVMSTGWHAARCAGVSAGDTVVVVGDGAVGLCGVLAAQRQGAARVVAMSRHESRQQLAREFGATDVIAERGDDAIAMVKELTDGVGADAVLECVGSELSMNTAIAVARAGATVGYVGLPHGVQLSPWSMFGRNVGLAGGIAPARAYIEELRTDVLSGQIDPGKVFDLTLPLAEVAEAYAAMDERRAIKSMLIP